jgi:hypothetical protein
MGIFQPGMSKRIICETRPAVRRDYLSKKMRTTFAHIEGMRLREDTAVGKAASLRGSRTFLDCPMATIFMGPLNFQAIPRSSITVGDRALCSGSRLLEPQIAVKMK